jgi:hypothetical protein
MSPTIAPSRSCTNHAPYRSCALPIMRPTDHASYCCAQQIMRPTDHAPYRSYAQAIMRPTVAPSRSCTCTDHAPYRSCTRLYFTGRAHDWQGAGCVGRIMGGRKRGQTIDQARVCEHNSTSWHSLIRNVANTFKQAVERLIGLWHSRTTHTP